MADRAQRRPRRLAPQATPALAQRRVRPRLPRRPLARQPLPRPLLVSRAPRPQTGRGWGSRSGRKVGGAVDRNRVKRLLREAFWAADERPAGRPRLRDRRATRGGPPRGRARRGRRHRGAARAARRAPAWRPGRPDDGPPVGRSSRPCGSTSARSRRRCPSAASTTRAARSTRSTARPRVRHTAGAGPGRLAPAALQPLEPRRRRLRRGPEALPPARLKTMLPIAIVPQSILDAFNDVLSFWPRASAAAAGASAIILLTFTIRLADPAAHLHVGEVDAEAPGAPAGDEEDPGALQGRPPAHEPGDDEVLPGEQGQSPGLLPPAAASDPVLHRALRAAAEHRVQGGDRGQRELPLHPRPGGSRSPASR